LHDLKQKLAQLEREIEYTQTQWQKERALVEQIKQRQQDITAHNTQEEITALREELSNVQGQNPLVFERVNAQIINEIISDWTGIPVGNMVNDEIKQILSLESKLAERVMGQDSALHQLVQGLKHK
jgi:type VI secretion system protein VasG